MASAAGPDEPEDTVFAGEIAEDLVPSRSEQPDETISLDFSGFLNPPLSLKQDLTEGCGGKTWPAGMALSEYLLYFKMDAMKDKTILELGAGSGLVGLALSLALEDATSTCPEFQTNIFLTDIPPMLPLLMHNITLNPTSIHVEACPLSWGEPIPPTLKLPDIILAADCCYFEPAFPLLLDTLEQLLNGKEGAICLFFFKKRRKADLGFVKMARKRFAIIEVDWDVVEKERWTREGIFMYELRAKPVKP